MTNYKNITFCQVTGHLNKACKKNVCNPKPLSFMQMFNGMSNTYIYLYRYIITLEKQAAGI